MDAGGVQGFIGVHVADAGDDGLVAQQGLDGGLAMAQALGEDLRGKIGLQGLRAQFDGDAALIRQQPHAAELARVAEGDIGAVEMDYGPRILVRGIVAEQQGAGHLQVNHQQIVTVQVDEEILAAPAEPGDALTDET
jgi:hypothetical protein